MKLSTQLTSEKISRLSLLYEGGEPINVLVVEDSVVVRMQLRRYIALLDNVNLIEADTLAKARVILEKRSHEIFCAVLDLTLPDANGLDSVDAVRAYDVPIIVLTASADAFLRKAVLDLHVVDYILKTGDAAVEDVAYLIGRLRQNQTMKVLVVDDSKTFQLHISGYLAQYRFVVLVARNGLEALEILQSHPDISLILVDYHMPIMNGMEMVVQVRRRYRREDLAIIALSDINHPELSAAMLKAGANDYLNKKFEAEQFFCRVVQNTNMVRFVRELRDMSNRDYLTRLYNRRYLFQVGAKLHADARAGHRKIAVAMVDADLFKRINDQFGHPAGDEALMRIAGVLRRSFSGADVVARYGGEEFVCIVTSDSLEEIPDRFEALRADIKAIKLVWQGADVPISVSIGLTTAIGVNLDEAIERADDALYQAKKEGRNRVVRFFGKIGLI